MLGWRIRLTACASCWKAPHHADRAGQQLVQDLERHAADGRARDAARATRWSREAAATAELFDHVGTHTFLAHSQIGAVERIVGGGWRRAASACMRRRVTVSDRLRDMHLLPRETSPAPCYAHRNAAAHTGLCDSCPVAQRRRSSGGPLRAAALSLVGPDHGKEVELGSPRLRDHRHRSDLDLVLTDDTVSRHPAELRAGVDGLRASRPRQPTGIRLGGVVLREARLDGDLIVFTIGETDIELRSRR